MKLNKSILILALEDSIIAHKKAGEIDYAWTIEQMEKNLEIIKQAHSVEAHEEKIKEEKIRLFHGCYVQTADGLVHGPVEKKDNTDTPFLGPPSLLLWIKRNGVMPGAVMSDRNTIVKVLDKNEV